MPTSFISATPFAAWCAILPTPKSAVLLVIRATLTPNSEAQAQESAYWGYERFIRSMESKLGSTVGGDGAIFAIRRELYTPLPAEAINDLVVPLQIVALGYRAVFDPAAVGIEPTAGIRRRISSQTAHRQS